jgi:RNA polymerase sigma-70 factor, ECF subfamily
LEDSFTLETPQLRAFLAKLAVAAPSLEVDDLVQETMNRALKYSHSLDPDRPVRPWLQSIAFRVFLDARAREQRQPQALDPVEIAERSAGDSALTGAGGSATRSNAALHREARQLLDALDEPEKSVMEQTYLQAKPIADVARALGLPAGTIKSHLHRARRRLAARFHKEDWL